MSRTSRTREASDVGAVVRPFVDEPLCAQQLESLAHGASADTELCRDLGFDQPFARAQDPPDRISSRTRSATSSARGLRCLSGSMTPWNLPHPTCREYCAIIGRDVALVPSRLLACRQSTIGPESRPVQRSPSRLDRARRSSRGRFDEPACRHAPAGRTRHCQARAAALFWRGRTRCSAARYGRQKKYRW